MSGVEERGRSATVDSGEALLVLAGRLFGCGFLVAVGVAVSLFGVLELLETYAFRALELLVLSEIFAPLFVVWLGATLVLAGLYGTVAAATRSSQGGRPE